MTSSHSGSQSADPDDLSLEVIMQRIFNEEDPVAHRAAIWELFSRSGDWDLFEQVADFGGERGITTYFQNILNHLEEPGLAEDEPGDFPSIPAEKRDQIQELYSAPLICMRNGDWAGSAAAMHDILLNEIYDIYQINEEILPFGDATSATLEKWVGEEVLFPLSVMEYMAFSDCLTGAMDNALLENHLSILLTLFFSAQAHLDVEESQERPHMRPGDIN